MMKIAVVFSVVAYAQVAETFASQQYVSFDSKEAQEVSKDTEPLMNCHKDRTDPEEKSGLWSGWWKNIGEPKKYLMTLELCITNHLIVGRSGLDDGRDFEVMIGSTLGNKVQFWQKFLDNGEISQMDCTYNPQTGVCLGTWYDYVKDTSGPWQMIPKYEPPSFGSKASNRMLHQADFLQD